MEEIIKKIKEQAQQNFVPIIRDKTAIALIDEIKKLQPKSILEIGTAVGYSGILMLNACENSKLITLEKDVERCQQAKLNFSFADFQNRVEVINCDAYEFLNDNNQKFDFVFLDGPKAQYIKYLPYILYCLNENGILFADNVLFKGMVLTDDEIPKDKRSIVNNLRLFINEIMQKMNTTICNTDDGYSISKKR